MSLEQDKLEALHKRYPGRRAVITGAGSGLGEALALELARHGWTLLLNDADPDRLTAVAQTCSGTAARVGTWCFDVADETRFEQAAGEMLAFAQGVDLIFTCAGIGVGGKLIETEPAHIREVVDVNLLGTIWAARFLTPNMARAGSGHFIAVASAAAFHGLPHLSAYAATKAGVVQFCETIRSELQPLGLDVTVKLTTFYTSNIAEYTRGPESERQKARSLVDMAPWSAEAVAEALLLAVQKRRFYLVAPRQARILWRLKRALPEFYLRLVPRLFPRLEAKLITKARAGKAQTNG